MKINHSEVLFILGYKLGELSREIELVIETAQRTQKKERHQIKVVRIYEALRYVVDEMIKLGASEEIQNDLTLYLSQLAKNYSEIKEKIESEQQQDVQTEMIVSKLKRKFARKNRDLKLDEAKELDMKLKIWKDRITLEFSRFSSN